MTGLNESPRPDYEVTHELRGEDILEMTGSRCFVEIPYAEALEVGATHVESGKIYTLRIAMSRINGSIDHTRAWRGYSSSPMLYFNAVAAFVPTNGRRRRRPFYCQVELFSDGTGRVFREQSLT